MKLKGSRASDCDLVFYGEKLEHYVRLSDVKQLNDSSYVYLIDGDGQQSSFANVEEIDKELASCKMLQKTISAEEEKKIYDIAQIIET
uniref:Uncharacterized protein n=1 Tax=Ditylenchus dipsaci TaxID=166011 RepID=A0A915EK36_9BILA